VNEYYDKPNCCCFVKTDTHPANDYSVVHIMLLQRLKLTRYIVQISQRQVNINKVS